MFVPHSTLRTSQDCSSDRQCNVKWITSGIAFPEPENKPFRSLKFGANMIVAFDTAGELLAPVVRI